MGSEMCIRDSEGTPQTVLKQKKLFQAQPAWVDLGTSTTNCHAYRVMLGKQRLIICSNTWLEQCARLSEADREWITSNQVLIEVKAPLWETADVAPEPPTTQLPLEASPAEEAHRGAEESTFSPGSEAYTESV